MPRQTHYASGVTARGAPDADPRGAPDADPPGATGAEPGAGFRRGSRADDPIAGTEAWFIRRGLPQFVDSYDTRRDVWTRAQPYLTAILVLELIPYAMVAFLPGGSLTPLLGALVVAVVLGCYALWSKWRRGFWFAPPNRVGWPFLIFFVLAPTGGAIALVAFPAADFGPITWVDVAVSVAIQVVILAAAYLITRFAVCPMLWWAIRQTFVHLGDLYTVATKALPLLLIVMLVLFVNSEMWQMAGTLSAGLLWSSVGILLVLGVLVTFDRTRTQIRDLDYSSSPDQVRSSCVGTPLEPIARELELPPEPTPLRLRERGNLIAAAMVTQLIQAAVLGFAVWLFFLIFGTVTISLSLQETWLAGLVPTDLFISVGEDRGVTRALFRVATFIAGFAAFYTTIYAATDDTYRRSFATDAGAELQQAIDVHRVYAVVNR